MPAVQAMKNRTLVPLTLALAILAWMVLSWPLPMHMTKAITLSAHEGESERIVYMTPGDSLQLMYYFELVHGWITGKTPWFYNLYEFNTGDDEERYAPGGYYAPFSLFYSATRSLTNQALGMNMAGIASLWLTVLATWFLLRRYVKDEWIVGLFSIFVILLPYRWKSLFDASPTGFAMMWVPILLLGLDQAVRDGKFWGGILAAFAVIMVYIGGDSHVFFFSVLAVPAWCLLALLAGSNLPAGSREKHVRMAQALVPVIIALVLVVFAGMSKTTSLHETNIETGRDIAEVFAFSPRASGFLIWQGGDISSQVYFGWSIAALILLGGLIMAWAFLRRPRDHFKPVLFMGLLCLGICLVAVLALGPNGFGSGRLFMLVREVIPPYAMIRQPGKIYCLMPTLLALAGALSLAALVRAGSSTPWWRGLCLVVVAVPMAFEYSRLSSPELIYLQDEQPAYEAVAVDAQRLGNAPRSLVIPLWPGDSHYASIYQHFSLMYRIRMINGYTPAVSTHYIENVFLKYESINQGYLSDQQADSLLDRGIRHMIVHEDLYPETVAPFPVTYAITRYLEHPRLHFLGRGDSVWAFRILDSPGMASHQEQGFGEVAAPYFPARHWEMEWSVQGDAKIVEDKHASNGQYVSLSNPEAIVRLAPTSAPPAPEMRWMIRCRGQGGLAVEMYAGGNRVQEAVIALNEQDWQWLEVPVAMTTFAELSLRLRHLEGSIDLDSALLFAGSWAFLGPGESMTIPAASFFHAGYTNQQQDHVVFLKKYYAKRVVLYGPRMPLEPGSYEVQVFFTADAEKGLKVGELHMRPDGVPWGQRVVPIYSGQDLRFDLHLESNRPWNMDFLFSGDADMIVESVSILRIE